MTDWTELVAWLGWASTAGVWAWRVYRPRFRRLPEIDLSSRHRLDTWTAALLNADAHLVRQQHGRGRTPDCIHHRGVTYCRMGEHPSFSTVWIYRAEAS